ncbi:WD40 repeat protein [Saccharothrix saharensis]|uniref:WD40 repeat protein n=1 Tax=Saccharothrix saharensis TaxID=571190 RepID=A0A543JMF0_9PSEU|nr:HYR domain-containing protein [Saccharothrix saharensis]TQM83944.1 WD40 repeat protein [Saccharothrix saharensis]
MRHLALVVLLLAGLVVAPPATAQPEAPPPYRIAVTRGDPGDIWTTDARGGDARQLTDTPDEHESEPAFSPDGTLIAFTRSYGDGSDIVITDGGDERVLAYGRHPSWSPDGTMVAMLSGGEVRVVRVSDGAELTTVPQPRHTRGHDEKPTWSPTGAVIAFGRHTDVLIPPRVQPYVVGASTSATGTFTTTATVRTPFVPARPEIVFLLDTTSSMATPVSTVRANIGTVMERIATAEPEALFGIATYQDASDGPGRYRLVRDLTTRDVLQTVLDDAANFPIGFGGDLPEDWFNALHHLARDRDATGRHTTFSDDAGVTRIIVLAGDAASHNSPDTCDVATYPDCPGRTPYWTEEEITTDLTDRDIHLVGVPVLLPPPYTEQLDSRLQVTRLADATDGVRVDGYEPDRIVAGIEHGITRLPVTVTPEAFCPPGVSVRFTPPTARAAGDTDVTFTETVTLGAVPGARAAADLECHVRFKFDDELPAETYEQFIAIDRADAALPTVVVNAHAAPSPDGTPVPVTFTATATDAAGAPLTPTCDATSGSPFPVGLTTVTCTATDRAGRTGRGSSAITVHVPERGPTDDLWLARLDGGDVVQQVDLSASFATPCAHQDSAPAWSPDGNRLVYRHGDVLCVADATGANATPITSGGETPDDPAWSPDGASIAFTMSGPDEHLRVWTVAPSGGTPAELVAFAREDTDLPAFGGLPDLVVTGSAAPAAIPFGGSTSVRLRVTNRGLAPAVDAELALAPPAGLEVEEITTDTGTCVATGCALGRLAPNGTAEVRVTVTGTAAGPQVLRASAPPDVNPGDNRVDVRVSVADEIRPPDHPGSLSLAVSPTPREGYVGGDALVLSYRVRNGASVPMTDVRVVTSLPPQLLPVGAVTGCTADGATCALGTLAPGQEAEVRVALPAKAAVDTTAGGSVLAVGPDDDAADNTAVTRVLVRQPVLAVDPGIGPTGFVPRAAGRSFPPGATVRLGWAPGLSPTPGEVVVRPDGTFEAHVLVFHNDRIGVRQLEAVPVVGPAFGPVRSGDFLVVPRTLQPPDFASRG